MSEKDDRYKIMLESSLDMFWEFDENVIFTYVSPSVYSILGYYPEEIVGKNAFDLMAPDEAIRVRKHFNPIANKFEPFTHLLNINLHKDGREVVIESSGTPVFDEKGIFRGYRGVDRDITRREENRQNSSEDTLFHYLNVGDLCSASFFLRNHGLDLLYNIDLERFKLFVDIYCEEKIREYGWLTFFIGTLALHESPPVAKSYFISAHKTFIKDLDSLGEIIIVSQLLHYFSFIECCYESGRQLLKNIEEGLDALLMNIDPTAAIHVAINLSIGYNFILSDYRKTMHFLSIASSLSATKNNTNIDALISFMRGMAANMSGKLENFREEIEASCSYLKSKNVSSFNKHLIRSMISNYYYWMGDCENFHRQSDEIYRTCGGNVVAKSSIDPWQLLMKADLEIGRGHHECAHDYLSQALQKGFASNLPHLKSQLYQSQALLLALSGERTEALRIACESEKARSLAGGAFFQLWNDCMLGASYVILDVREQASLHLNRAINQGSELGIEPMLAGAHASLAFQAIRDSNVVDACREIETCLTIMKKHKLSNFFSWTPQIMTGVLCFAVRQNIETDYARFLIRERLGAFVDSDGSLQPLLKIEILGNMQLSQDNQVVISSQEITPIQRQFIELLVCAPANRISQEKIQAFLWPDKNSKNAQGAFDVFLHRWRKLISSRLGIKNVGSFFKSVRGIVSLENCLIDSVLYEDKANSGLNSIRRGKQWRGWGDLHQAMNIWSGDHEIDIFYDQAGAYQSHLATLSEQVCLNWVKHLRFVDNIYESINVLRRVLRGNHNSHVIVRELYQSYLLVSEKHLAKKLLDEYSEQLVNEGCSQDEIKDIVSEILDYNISK